VGVIMAVTQFEGEGPVARYWLANCEGFVVKGGAHGVVEELIRDADPHVTTRLVIRTRARRRRVISASAVSTVVPADSVLIVAHRRARGHMWRQRLPHPTVRVEAVRAGAVRVIATVGPLTRAGVKRFASAGRPTRLALAVVRRRLVVFAAVAWRLGRPALLVLTTSFRSLSVESQATGRMLVRSTSRFRRKRPKHAG
jgi:hypothetical protein